MRAGQKDFVRLLTFVSDDRDEHATIKCKLLLLWAECAAVLLRLRSVDAVTIGACCMRSFVVCVRT